MEDLNPLIYVAIAYLVLWIVGKVFAKKPDRKVKSKVENSVENSDANSNTSTVGNSNGKKQRGVKFASGLRVLGLDDEDVDTLKSLIKEVNEEKLAYFIAYKRPNFIELEQYFGVLRGRFLKFLGKPIEVTSEIEKISAANRVMLTDHPKNIDIKALNSSELRNLYAFEPMRDGTINQEFLNRFGKEEFMELFKSYMELSNPGSDITIYVPMSDAKRKALEKLLITGLVSQGRKLTLEQRLNVLNLREIQDMAKNLNIEEIPTSKEEGIKILADSPDSSAALFRAYEIDDVFLVKHKKYYENEILMEWTAYKAYAKVLCNPTGEYT